MTALSASVAISVVAAIFWSGLYTPMFGVDCWSYLELSNTVFHDFYRTNTHRQFQFFTPYSNAFPPVYPVLIALVRQVAPIGIYAAHLVNFFACSGLLFALIALCRRLGMPGSLGSVALLCLFSVFGFYSDAVGAGPVALSILFFVVALCFLVRPEVRPRDAALAGLSMGLSCMTRFDILFAAVAMGCIPLLRSGSDLPKLLDRVKSAVLYFVLMGAALSPWMLYSIKHFGKPFASDNTRQVLMAENGHVLDYYESEPAPDLIHRPGTWLLGFARAKFPWAMRFLMRSIYGSFIPTLTLIVLIVWGNRPPIFSREAVRFMLFGAALIPLLILPSVLTGYGHYRYFASTLLVVILALLIVLNSQITETWVRPRMLLPLAILATPLVYQLAVQPYLAHRTTWMAERERMAPLAPTPAMEALSEAVRRDAGKAPFRLLYMQGGDDRNRRATMYGALTGEPTSMVPRQIHGRFAAFIRDWGITHAYDPEGALAKIDTGGVEVVPFPFKGAFRLRQAESRPRTSNDAVNHPASNARAPHATRRATPGRLYRTNRD